MALNAPPTVNTNNVNAGTSINIGAASGSGAVGSKPSGSDNPLDQVGPGESISLKALEGASTHSKVESKNGSAPF